MSSSIPITLPLSAQEVTPNIISSDLKQINGVLSSYTTQFNPDDYNRTENIELAAKSINGVLLKSGDLFSFNNLVGHRISENGYKIAPVFIDGKLVPDWGGGVCQVSSTLYNAALLADMAIVERTSHYHPPGYVPLGLDATVADNQLDFKFKNSLSNNIYIVSKITGDELTVYIFGKQGENVPEIRILTTDKKVLEPNTIIKQDPRLEAGREIVDDIGQKGFQVTTYRAKYENGKELSRELISYDEFPSEDRIVRVGTLATLKK
jgi:vancomycin resistance protein YoaR